MSYHVHEIDGGKHREFLAEQRKDPVTKQTIRAGDRVVFCANCNQAFLEDSWLFIKEKHCGQSDTLRTFPSTRSTRRFSSKNVRRGNFRITNISTNTQLNRAPIAPRTVTPVAAPIGMRVARPVPTPAALPPNLNVAAPVIGGVFVAFVGLILLSVAAFLTIKFGFSRNDNSSGNSNALVKRGNERTYSNTTVNLNNSAYANSNKPNNVGGVKNSSPSCRLFNDKSYENRVFIRSDCDFYDCDTDKSRVIDSLPDNTSINIIKGVSRIKSNVQPYSWIKVEIIDSGQIVWVADSKIKCD